MPVVTFQEFTPPARADGEPWVSARIEESSAEGGPTWTLIETVALSPVDTDPSNPKQRAFTTELATLDEGWYRITFVDGEGDVSQATPPIHNSPAADFNFLPTVSQVAVLIRARTRDEGGNDLGTFTTATTPTANQAEALIHDAATEITEVTGTGIPEALWRNARSVIALSAAMAIELGYFPEQVQSSRSAYTQLEKKFERRLKSLSVAVEQAGAGDAFGSSDDEVMPSGGGFPSTAIGMENPW